MISMGWLDNFLKKYGSLIMYLSVILFFMLIVFIPPIYVLSYAFEEGFVLDSVAKTSIILSFEIAIIVTLVCVIFGLPTAWILARKRIPYRLWVDTLIDLPLVVPTAVLGISIWLFWGSDYGLLNLFGITTGLFSKGPMLIILLHIVFTFPYVVRSIEAAIYQIDMAHEEAARVLGAPSFTVFRTISLPLFKSGLISGAILAFTRSLSETGATMMVAGLSQTAPILVVTYKKANDITSAAAVSIILIITAVILLLITKLLTIRVSIPIKRAYPILERKLVKYNIYRDTLTIVFIALIILIPTFFIVISGINKLDFNIGSVLLKSILISFLIAFFATVINLIFALPMGNIIARDKFHTGPIFDMLNDIILLVPTSALGLSLGLFWKNFALNEFLILILTHISFSFPYIVKPIAASISGVDQNLIEAARSLGATPLRAFRTVTYPLIKPAIIAGIIMGFMRSLSETGATLAVSEKIKTIPVLLVEIFNKNQFDEKAIFTCILLFLLSFIFILILKKTEERGNARHRSSKPDQSL